MIKHDWTELLGVPKKRVLAKQTHGSTFARTLRNVFQQGSALTNQVCASTLHCWVTFELERISTVYLVIIMMKDHNRIAAVIAFYIK